MQMADAFTLGQPACRTASPPDSQQPLQLVRAETWRAQRPLPPLEFAASNAPVLEGPLRAFAEVL